MRDWAWPQGRTQYLNFDNIKRIARSIVKLDGTVLAPRKPDPLKAVLSADTGLEFKAPGTHKTWRNYDKTFECSLIATNPNNQVRVTDLCRALADTLGDPIDVDQYLSFLIPRFYSPFPAFETYSTTTPQEYPFCAVLKYLLAMRLNKGKDNVSYDDIIAFVLGNGCVGTEGLDFYSNLKPVDRALEYEPWRQMRESLVFLSQSSFLKWHKNNLYLDIIKGDAQSEEAFRKMLEPLIAPRLLDPADEIMALGAGFNVNSTVSITSRETPADVLFVEGSRARATHLRIERSQYLRNSYFASLPRPYACDICEGDMKKRYYWTDNILEIHHLLPLSSSLIITKAGTSLQDVVALCPNCHRSVHEHYKQWLGNKQLKDFTDEKDARRAYEEVRGMIAL